MHETRDWKRNVFTAYWATASLLGFIFTLTLCASLLAQSQKANEDAGKNERPAILIVRSLPYISSSNIYTSDVIDGCFDRLKESHTVTANTGPEMNRKEAIDRAKSKTGTYVLWIELQQDVGDTDKAGVSPPDPNNLYAIYTLFAPGTGKVATQGHSYQRPLRSTLGTIGSGGPFPSENARRAASYPLYRAGREVGDRVLSSLNLGR